MAKKLIISFLLAFLLSNMIIIRCQNKFFDESKVHRTKSGFTNSYLFKNLKRKSSPTGIYEELLKSISSINFKIFISLKDKNIKSVWQKINGNFLACIFSGILFSVFSLSKTITFLIKSYPVLVWSFFFGLILASSFIIGRK